MDISKLKPAPCEQDIAFCALARKAFEVMDSRKWGVVWLGDQWAIMDNDDDPPVFSAWCQRQEWSCPFAALVEADEWYKTEMARWT